MSLLLKTENPEAESMLHFIMVLFPREIISHFLTDSYFHPITFLQKNKCHICICSLLGAVEKKECENRSWVLSTYWGERLFIGRTPHLDLITSAEDTENTWSTKTKCHIADNQSPQGLFKKCKLKAPSADMLQAMLTCVDTFKCLWVTWFSVMLSSVQEDVG